ncbi:hypothetical protein BH10ACT9_BH10ACT9_07900 [soil metagenome]
MAPEVLMESTATALIGAPVESVDIADWLFHLTDDEYQRCAPGDHVAAGATTTDDGRPMSINVEQVGPALLIQHYVGDVVTRHHCRLVSDSDNFTPVGRTKVGVIWELTVTGNGENECTFTNHVVVLSTDDYLSFLDSHGVPLDLASTEGQTALERHNNLETPLYAKSIERMTGARAGVRA